MKRSLPFALLAALSLATVAAALPAAAQEHVSEPDPHALISADGPRDTELCNLPAEGCLPAGGEAVAGAAKAVGAIPCRERYRMVMAAARIRKEAVKAAGTREVRRTARKAFNAVWRSLADRHELTASYGLFPTSWSYGYAAGFDSGGGYSFRWDGHTYSYSDIRSTGGFAVGYMYRLSRRWSAGVSASLSKAGRDLSVDGLKVSEDRTVTLGIATALRLNWIDRPMVKCYSEIQIGYACDYLRTDAGDGGRWRRSYMFISPTVAGVSVGRRLHGFAEFGAALRGLFCAGVGYSF